MQKEFLDDVKKAFPVGTGRHFLGVNTHEEIPLSLTRENVKRAAKAQISSVYGVGQTTFAATSLRGYSSQEERLQKFLLKWELFTPGEKFCGPLYEGCIWECIEGMSFQGFVLY